MLGSVAPYPHPRPLRGAEQPTPNAGSTMAAELPWGRAEMHEGMHV